MKVCGISRLEDALAACRQGAWAVGFVFHPPSPRHVSVERAAEIARKLPPEVLAVGVFVDWPLGELNEAVRRAGLAAVQLHGEESPEYAAAVEAREVWKAFRVGPGFRLESLDAYPAAGRILLDAHSPRAAGGTGETFDWEVARRASERRPVILAGGLTPANVAEALRRVRPFAVDLSSGVEATPGRKDPRKLRALFAAVRRFEAGRARGE